MKELTTQEIIELCFENKLTIFFTTIFFLFSGFYFSVSDERIYTASATVIQNPDSALVNGGLSQSQGIEKILNLGGSGSDQTDIYIEIMHSQEFLKYFFNKRDIIPFLFAAKKDPKTSNIIFDDSIYNKDTGLWVTDRDLKEPTINESARHWRDSIFDFEIGKKSIIKIHITYLDGLIAKQWLDQFIEDFNQFVAEQTKDDSILTSNYLERTLDTTKSESTREALSFLLIEQQRKLALASSIPDFALKTINPAVEADLPSNISTLIVLILSTLFGLMAAFVLIIFRISLNN